MGNTIDHAVIGNGELKLKSYPSQTDVKNDEWMPVEFLSKTQQNQEIILSINGDQRVRAMPSDYTLDDDKQNDNKKVDCNHPIYNIGRLKMEFTSTVHGFGSAVVIHHVDKKSFALTAAHNVVLVDEDDKDQLDYPQAIWFEINQNSSNNGYVTLKRYQCSKYHIHPKYIKYCKSNISQSATGFDIAIIEVLDPQNELGKIKPFSHRSYKSEIKGHCKIKVIGYPGEPTLRGQLYGMTGDGNMGFINRKVQINPLIVYNNIDTTGGQSGCPIFKCSIDEKQNAPYNSFGEIIGIHVVGKKKKKVNYGTFLNDNILKWIYKIIDIPLPVEQNIFHTLQQKFKSKPNYTILMLSLDAAGTTALLYKWKLGENVTTIPTIGFCVEDINHGDIVFTIWEMNGCDKTRPLWKHYYNEDVAGIIFLVDSSDRLRIDENDCHDYDCTAKKWLYQDILSSDKLRKNIPLLVYANKQDLDNAMSPEEVKKRLDLESITDRPWTIFGSCVTTGDGIYKGLDWLAQHVEK